VVTQQIEALYESLLGGVSISFTKPDSAARSAA
jgi:hypothetical protein